MSITTHRPGSGALALLPTNMRDAMEIASMMSKAGFFPKELQSPGACLFVVEQAMRWNMSPYAVATEISFPQGKPMFSGKLVAAAIQSSGAIAGRIHYTYSGEGDARTVTVSATLRGETEPVSVDVRLRDARTNNAHWTKSADQMLAYHGARVWARRYCPEVMLGVYAPEEFDEAPAASPLPPARGPVVEAQAAPAPSAPLANGPKIGEGWPVLNSQRTLLDAPPARWLQWVRNVLAKLESAEAVRAWRNDMEPHFAIVAANGGADDVDAAREDIARRVDEFEMAGGGE